MKKFCFVIHSLETGGMERVMSILANDFVARDDTEMHLILIGMNRQINYFLDKRVKVHQPDFTFKNSRRLIDTLHTIWFLRKQVKKIQPDILLSFGEMWNNLVLLSLSRLPVPVYISDRSQPGKDLGTLHNFLRRVLYPKAAGFIAQTEQAKLICEKNNWNSNIKVIGNPIRSVKSDTCIEKQNIVLTVGRLISTKNIDHLIEIFADLDIPGWKLVIVGGDSKKLNLSKDLNKLIERLGMQHKIFLEGNQTNVDSYYNRSKIFAFTSSSEGFPNVIGEALSAGLPVVAYNCLTGPEDLIENGVNGYLVPLFDKKEFRLKLKKLMESMELREQFSQNSNHYTQNFNEKKIVDNYYTFMSSSL